MMTKTTCMKHNCLILAAIAFVMSLAFASCKKQEQEILTPKIIDDKVETTATTATFTWTVDWPGKIVSVVEVSENEDMSHSQTYGSVEETGNHSFTVTATDLEVAKKYYYRYLVWNKNFVDNKFEMKQKEFVTKTREPTVSTTPVSNITWTQALGGGYIVDDGGEEIIERGLCWSLSHNPDISDEYLNCEVGMGGFTVQMTDLSPHTTYYVRAYAKNRVGVGFGNEESFCTSEEALPGIITYEISDVSWTTATGGGEVVSDGGTAIIEYGLCWSNHNQPNINDNYAICGSGISSFSIQLMNLLPGTTYYVRAYAKNNTGLEYGNEVCFSTNSPEVPTLTTNEITSISWRTAESGGEVLTDGGSEIINRGICWSFNPNPSISDSHTVNGAGLGEFVAEMNNLNGETLYYVCAYAINSTGIGYGNTLSFSTLDIVKPIVNTLEANYVLQTTGTCVGTIITDGGTDLLDVGICWSTSPYPTLNDHHMSAHQDTIGDFMVQLSNLNPNTAYYYCAYATNNKGTGYGEAQSFMTLTNIAEGPIGTIKGRFSVSDNKQVWFSKGNLQYQASTNTWRFAEHQWSFVGSQVIFDGGSGPSGPPGGNVAGSSNHLISSSYSGWIDLFCWGTSGKAHGAVCYQPWSTDWHDASYYAYGVYTKNLYDSKNDGSCSGWADWGQNAINCDGVAIPENSWRTLTAEEWSYVIANRNTSSGILGVEAVVNDVHGVILLPDSWYRNTYLLDESGSMINTISVSDWTTYFESCGAVFFPTTGYRSGNSLYWVNSSKWYWSSSWSSYYGDDDDGHASAWTGHLTSYVSSVERATGCAVRLVYDCD